MPTRAIYFFRSTVEPTAMEFFQDSLNTRRGRLACIVLYHMADYWALNGYDGADRRVMEERLKELRTSLIDRCPDFVIIRDVADASKHALLSVPKQGARALSSSDQIGRSPGIFGAPFGTAMFNEASLVMVTLDNGSRRPLDGPVSSVLSMWREIVVGGTTS